MTGSTNMDADKLARERWNSLWTAQCSQRYHSRRQAFYERWGKLTIFIGVVGGSAAFATIGDALPAWIGTISAAAVVVLSGADLVTGTGEMARRHNDLRRRFCELESEIVHHADADENLIANWKSKRLTIESDEPPTYVALNVLCENELARAYGHLREQQPHQIPWYKRATAHWFIWEGA